MHIKFPGTQLKGYGEADNNKRFYDNWSEKRINDWAQYRKNYFVEDVKKPDGISLRENEPSKQDLLNDKIGSLKDIDVRWSDTRSVNEEERVKWKQDMKNKLEVAKAERKRERDELKRQRELIRDRKIELEHYQREMLRELDEEINELEEEEKELLKEKEEIDKEINLGLSFYSTESPF
jgi:hypothetical protein